MKLGLPMLKHYPNEEEIWKSQIQTIKTVSTTPIHKKKVATRTNNRFEG